MLITVKGEYNTLEVLQVVNGKNHRETILPNSDLSGRPSEILEAIAQYHTPEIKAAYQAVIDEQDKQFEVDPQVALNAAARAYLAETDWYVIRFADNGVAMPDDVSAKRAAARQAVTKL